MNALLLALSLTFIWDPVTTNVDGSQATIKSYQVYRQKVGSSTRQKVVSRVGTKATVSVTTAGSWNYCVTAIDKDGKESQCSNLVLVETEICKK